MRIDVERFLTITALLAAGGAVAAGVGSEDVDNKPPDGGIVGAGGMGGRGGSAGRGGSSGSGGTAGRGGSGGTSDASAGTSGTGGTTGGSGGTGGAAGDASVCLGDTKVSDAADPACETLPYSEATCGDAGDGPLGLELCRYMHDAARAGIYEALHDCLMDVAGDGGNACSTAHGDAAQECLDLVLPQACHA